MRPHVRQKHDSYDRQPAAAQLGLESAKICVKTSQRTVFTGNPLVLPVYPTNGVLEMKSLDSPSMQLASTVESARVAAEAPAGDPVAQGTPGADVADGLRELSENAGRA